MTPGNKGLPPYPTGWYAVALSSELRAGELRRGEWFGREWVLFRTAAGRPVMMDAYCPHLGAHLGVGGCVVGESIRCPFHGFCFDGDGRCTATPYGKKLPRARAATAAVVEKNGAIMAWLDTAGRAPWFELPEVDLAGFGPLLAKTWPRLRSHPQETSENSVDFGHLGVVHGYTGLEILAPLALDGPYLNTKYLMHRKNPFNPLAEPIEAEFEVHVHGLGHSHVDVAVPKYGMQSRHFVWATPLDAAHIELRVAVSVRVDDPGRVVRPLGWLPRGLGRAVIERVAMYNYAHDVSQDFDIWANKQYLQPPSLADGDGPIGPYRRWCRQFYPELAQAEVALA